jgi:hypothetical protein
MASKSASARFCCDAVRRMLLSEQFVATRDVRLSGRKVDSRESGLDPRVEAAVAVDPARHRTAATVSSSQS